MHFSLRSSLNRLELRTCMYFGIDSRGISDDLDLIVAYSQAVKTHAIIPYLDVQDFMFQIEQIPFSLSTARFGWHGPTGPFRQVT
jgi:hypothetical protein